MSWREIWDQLAAYGPLGMFVIAIVDTAFLPTAQAVDLLVVVQAAAAPSLAPLLLVCMVAGSVTGAMILWSIARQGGAWALRKSFKEQRIEKVRRQIRQYDAAALILPAALPLPLSPMKAFVFAAGALGVGAVRTALAFGFGRLLRYGLLIALGVWFGDEAWPLIKEHAGWAIAAALALTVVWFWYHSRARNAPSPPDRGSFV
jgi:membrane protein YqaA with SNARE-associated domain